MLRILPFILSIFLLQACGNNAETSKENTDDTDAKAVPKTQKTPDIVGQPVSYQADSVVMNGYIAYDRNIDGKRPGILVVHEWWGHNEHARNSADYLASLGYTALAVDMYGDGKKADHPSDASAFSSAVMSDFDGAQDRFKAAMEQLLQHPTVEDDEIGAVGYCFGGGVVLNMARQGMDLEGVVSIHGSLNAVEPAQEGEVEARILVLTGEDDPFVPKEARQGFKAEMDAAGVEYNMIAYEGAVHAFSNPKATEMGEKFDLPLAYDAKADSASKAEMKAFFNDIFSEE